MPQADCPFCRPDENAILADTGTVRILADRYPLNPGHRLITPCRHFARWHEATPGEKQDLLAAIDQAYKLIRDVHTADAFNVGWNDGSAAGQTIDHFHIHVVPRLQGDVRDPRGGVRWVLPERAPYWTQPSLPVDLGLLEAPHAEGLISGDADPLLPHLASCFAEASAVDIAVAFVMRRGVDVLRPHLEDLLQERRHSSRLRLLTGDYLDATEPDGLEALVDLSGDRILRVFESRGKSFHPKSYIFHFPDGQGIAFVGSSNLTKTALEDGIEWNYRLVRSQDQSGFASVVGGFERLFAHHSTRALTHDWIESYRNRRIPPQSGVPSPLTGIEADATDLAVQPHPVQAEALEQLEASRDAGDTAGLVVLATGLGKTWLAAFDSCKFQRVLFVAHREEILDQAIKTFRRIRSDASIGRFTGSEKTPDTDILFASVQTLARTQHLDTFATNHFDYVIVDEFHHAAAATYRALIDHFEPRFLLGLTATPERTDGADLLSLCGHNLVYRRDLGDGIREGLLSPFHYLGVPDDVDYAQIPWRSSHFDEEALTQALATHARAANALENFERYGGEKALGFCSSRRHADFMANWFNEHGKRAAAVHAGATSAPRTLTMQALERGELDIVFSVDMFNEGVDVPTIDTVLMLRPTESRILWLQQLGRGLRKAEGKEHLRVIDYIGNHRIFLNKPQALLGALLGVGEGAEVLRKALEQLKLGELTLPPGCEVTYDLVETLLEELLKPTTGTERLRMRYVDFRERHGRRPTPAELLYNTGSLPKQTLKKAFRSWFEMVKELGDLTHDEEAVLSECGAFLTELETMRMTLSLKMLVLQAALAADALPGSLPLEVLASRFQRIANRTPRLRAEVEESVSKQVSLEAMLESNPIAAWARTTFFDYSDRSFETAFHVAQAHRDTFRAMVTELVDWRLAEYLERRSVKSFECAVSSNQGHPILELPRRDELPGLPEGTVPLWADGQRFEAHFAKIAINRICEPTQEKNALPDLLRRWFGNEAGAPGRSNSVVCEREADGYRMRPMRRQLSEDLKVHDDDGNPLDATFRVEMTGDSISVLFFSRGGQKGTGSARNTEYTNGLKVLIERMARLGLVLQSVELDSKGVGERLSTADRMLVLETHPYPVDLGNLDSVSTLLSELKRAQSNKGRKPGATGSGNATKQIRLGISLPDRLPRENLGALLREG
ncbi:MAG: DEAD/DEAH box helicase family protein [Planctomycetes bacterium]|nr:DEAD/DEAH box helicase family protein [Planctomycetota bacterium]MCB9920285.1 DEAD/DEAH box helicase family protein [Planctomycetota bacterium]